jgi:AraC-like DNA-binding protein
VQEDLLYSSILVSLAKVLLMSADPLAEIVTLLQPSARLSKLVECAGHWRIHREATREPFYCAILEGRCRMRFGDHPPIDLQAGDFVLAPAMQEIVNETIDGSSDAPADAPTRLGESHLRFGPLEGAADMRMRIGHCSFGAPDSALLVSLLPDVILVRDNPRLSTLIQLVDEETRARRSGRELVLERLLEVLLIEALRSGTEATSTPGLSRGLGDERVAAAIHAMHDRPGHAWTVVDLAKEAALSRSAFFARFSRTVGVAPMEYLLAWRMALAKKLLADRKLGVEDVAERIGYGSASAFSVAFARHAGMPPARYAREAG